MTKYILNNDTIVALATPLGNGAISVIRLSGTHSLSILNNHLTNKLDLHNPRVAVFNHFLSKKSGELIDQVITTYFKKPHSYTGEDVVEISSHCNPLIINQIIQELVQSGARVAQPGEFTFRAFMNGKLDLAQAEAVAETIAAKSTLAVSQALRHLEGRFSQEIRSMAEELLSQLALVEINLDFSEEEIEPMPLRDFKKKLQAIIDKIGKLLSSYDYGKVLSRGLKLLIIGKPNVGKSSLLNMLIGSNRAIVSSTPGTTRDYIESHIEIDGTYFEIVDTAGIRETKDEVEAIGIERALNHLDSSDITLCLFEAHTPFDSDDRVLLQLIDKNKSSKSFIGILNKIDLGFRPEVMAQIESLKIPAVKLSTLTRSGERELHQTIKRIANLGNDGDSEEIVVTSLRHRDALAKACAHLKNAIEAIEAGGSEELVALDARLALDALGEITGENAPDQVLDHIFANFCIGK